MDINKYSKEIHEANKLVGWWDDPNRCLYTVVQMISTEIAEATEGERKNLMDDHLPHLKMGEVELADVLIRTLDFGGYLGFELEDISMSLSSRDEWNAPKLHYYLNSLLFCTSPYNWSSGLWSMFVCRVIQAAEILGYDIEYAMTEKLAYNAKRSDHKRENRQLDNGKKF